MNRIRDGILEALNRVAGGGDVDHEALIAILDPEAAKRHLRGVQSTGYWELWRWADDADIRAKEPNGAYEMSERQKLSRLRNSFLASESDRSRP